MFRFMLKRKFNKMVQAAVKAEAHNPDGRAKQRRLEKEVDRIAKELGIIVKKTY